MNCCSKSYFFTVAFVLVLIGGINWGLVGLFNFDLVAFLFGSMTIVTRMIYAVIGIAALMKAVCFIQHFSDSCDTCKK